MSEHSRPLVPKWPFFLGDALLLGVAGFVYFQSKLPLPDYALGAICGCVAFGALLAVLPFIFDYRVALKLAESENLTDTVAQIKNLEDIAKQINLATGLWQTVQAHSGKTVTAAKEIADRMTSEAKAFAEFMQRANDAEKGTLRLETEKLRRAETDWAQVAMRMLDHTFALHAAAARGSSPALAAQIAQFQNAQRDAARRVGLIPFVATTGEAFDEAKHKARDVEKPEAGATIDATLAPGFTLRGQLVRPALVTLASKSAPQAAEPTPPTETASAPATPQEQTLL